MKNLNLFFILFLVGCLSLFSQNAILSGTVKNEENIPIEYANVFLLSEKDSSLIKGSTTDANGVFELTAVKYGKYLLKASYIDNESKPIPLDIARDMDKLNLLLSSNQQLDEVVVTQLKPRLEKQVDRLVFNIENTPLVDGDIWDVLKKTPNIMIINDALTVKGSGSIGILINGRKVNIPQQDIINLLSGTSAGNVEAIEVITNPPAKYSAEGGMLVNIKMKKNLIAGYNGAIYNKYTQGVYPKNLIGTDHYFKGEKSSFSINYSFNQRKLIYRIDDVTRFFETNGSTSTWDAKQDNLRRSQLHNLSMFFDYDFNAKNRISFSSINLWEPNRDNIIDSKTSIVNSDGTDPSSFNTVNNGGGNRLNTSYYLDFVHNLDNGGELSFNTHYSYYDLRLPTSIFTDFYDAAGNQTAENDFVSNNNQRINLFTGQADYYLPLNDDIEIETGLRYSDVHSVSNILQQGFDASLIGITPTERGAFTYDEQIMAGYISQNAAWDKWNLKTGLRAEYTETIGSLNTEPENNKRSYLELFPSASVQYNPSKKHGWELYYFRRIDRPRYRDINPFQLFLTNNSYKEGEPNLLPSTRNYIAAGYTYNKGYTLELFYRNEKNPFDEFVLQDNATNTFKIQMANSERKINYGADLIINERPFSFWDLYFFASYYSVQYNFIDPISTEFFENRRWVSKAQFYSSFTLLSDSSLFADLDFVYYSAIPIGNSVQDGYNQLSVSFRKSLWDKKVSVSLGLQDIFNQGNLYKYRDYGNQSNATSFRAENRLFTFGLRYKFGNTGIRDNQKSKNLDERDRF